MPKQWQLPVAGREVTFIAEEGPNGKLVLRVNGRMVAQPLGPGETVRRFTFEGRQFLIRRTDEGAGLEDVTPPPLEPIEFGSTTNLAPSSIVWRGRIYFTVALLIFIGSLTSCMRIRSMQETVRRAQNPVILNGEQPDTRGLERTLAAGELMMSGLAWETFFAFFGMMGAGILMRGFRWASKGLEVVTWLMFLFVVFMTARVDRLVHTQMNAAYDPLPAAAVIHKLHVSSVTSMIFFGLIAGGMLHLIGHRTIDRCYEEEGY
ncbi:MAG TPA: hypothetical protein VLV78_16240 [Thermoanaerobaculia bacterium]|nr:hypothetical protein [Thermoanaerobaculia bacterium]